MQASRSATDNSEVVESAQRDLKVSSYAKKKKILCQCFVTRACVLSTCQWTLHSGETSILYLFLPAQNAHAQTCHSPLWCHKGKLHCASVITSSKSATTHNPQPAVCSGLWESCFHLLPNIWASLLAGSQYQASLREAVNTGLNIWFARTCNKSCEAAPLESEKQSKSGNGFDIASLMERRMSAASCWPFSLSLHSGEDVDVFNGLVYHECGQTGNCRVKKKMFFSPLCLSLPLEGKH